VALQDGRHRAAPGARARRFIPGGLAQRRADPLFPWESGWKDTVLLNDRETVDVLVRFDAYRGLYASSADGPSPCPGTPDRADPDVAALATIIRTRAIIPLSFRERPEQTAPAQNGRTAQSRKPVPAVTNRTAL